MHNSSRHLNSAYITMPFDRVDDEDRQGKFGVIYYGLIVRSWRTELLVGDARPIPVGTTWSFNLKIWKESGFF